jgi:hypothetical protein
VAADGAQAAAAQQTDRKLGGAGEDGAPASPRLFDVAVSLSSFDHDGLGRYGDPLCPDCDLLAATEVALRYLRRPQVTQLPDGSTSSQGAGLLFLSVPVGPDELSWNLHRRYGPLRLPLLLDGYHIMDRIGRTEAEHRRALVEPANIRRSYEPIFVLEPKARLFTNATALDRLTRLLEAPTLPWVAAGSEAASSSSVEEGDSGVYTFNGVDRAGDSVIQVPAGAHSVEYVRVSELVDDADDNPNDKAATR